MFLTLALWTLVIDTLLILLTASPNLVLLSNAAALSGFFFAVVLLRRRFDGQLFEKAVNIAATSYFVNIGTLYVIIDGLLQLLSQSEFLWALIPLTSIVLLGFIMPYSLARHVEKLERDD